MNVRKEELGELLAQVPSLGEEAGDTDMSIERRFLDLLEPLERRKKQLESSRAKLQITRDLEDETVSWPQTSPPGAEQAAAIRITGCRPGRFLTHVQSSHLRISEPL